MQSHMVHSIKSSSATLQHAIRTIRNKSSREASCESMREKVGGEEVGARDRVREPGGGGGVRESQRR
jgi:hypothetical protein